MAQTATPSKKSGVVAFARQTLRVLVRTTFTLAVIAGAVFAVQFGASELTKRADAAPSPDPAPRIPVSAQPLTLETGYTIDRAFIGQVEAGKTVNVSFELPGLLASISVDEGDQVTKGQSLATQDTSLLEAERTQLLASKSATEAQLKFAEQTVARNEELQRRGFAPQAGVDEALARRDELIGRIAEIEAGLKNVEIRLDKANLAAPFDGLVTERFVDGGESLGAGQVLLGLVETRAPQVRVGVPLDLDASTLADAMVEIDGARMPATLTSLRPDIDPITRTRMAIFSLDADAPVAFGQTARLLVTEDVTKDGFWIPITSLQEGVRGQWTLLTVDETSTVRAAQVEILHAETDRVFARAAFADGTPLIDAGPQRVTVGQQVIVNSGE